MKHVLIITEDIIKIQTLSGLLGRLFKFIYLAYLKLRLQIIVMCLRTFFKVTVIASDAFKLKFDDIYYYGNELAKLDFDASRRRHLRITERLLKNFHQPLFKIRLAAHLTYEYFVYVQLYERLIKKINPDLIITLSSSYHEQIARYLAKSFGIKLLKFHLPTFIWLNHWLKKFFLKRQYQKKIHQFMVQTQVSHPPLNQLRSATLLSLDFFRHFKILAPIYQSLGQHQHNPWLVTDMVNVKPVLKNLGQASANYFFLASFLPADFVIRPVSLPERLDSVNNLDDFLYNLGLSITGPMISFGQTLSQLYLAAAENLFKQILPKAVVVVSDLRFGELALAAVARGTKTRSLLVSPNTLLALDQLNGYETTEKVAVVGEFIKQQLVYLGLDSAKINITGDPQTENYRQLTANLDPKKVFKTLGLNPDQKIVLLISFGPSQMIPKPEKEAFFKLASQAVESVKKTVLVIKPHPAEKRYRVVEEVKSWGMTKAIVADNNQLELVELLHSCSVVLQTWSMTIFEAIMMNRPVISINPFKKKYGSFLPIIKDGGAIEVFSLNQLQKWLAILIDPNRQQTKKQLQRARQASGRFITAPDGHVADRILELLFG